MKISIKGFILIAILLGAAGAVPTLTVGNAFAQTTNSTTTASNSTTTTTTTTTATPTTATTTSSSITVTTDKTSYNDGDVITISGGTKDYLADTPLTLIVRNPIGNVIKVDQIQVGTDKTFSSTLTATGSLWQSAGTYTIFVQYGSADRTASTTFEFTGSKVAPAGPSTIPVDGTNYSVSYTITNGKVLNIKADPQSKSLIVSIQTTGDGVLTITMPRALIDAKMADGTDDQFFVLNDGQESQFDEVKKTTSDRTLSIPFKDGTETIEIIGTFVIPEFGPIAALVLAIAIVSIIALSAKTGLRLVPKY